MARSLPYSARRVNRNDSPRCDTIGAIHPADYSYRQTVRLAVVCHDHEFTTSSLDLLVIGGASLDVYHLANGQTVHSPGGAGLYTALAAACSGARAGMFAPRPDPMPEPLQVAAERIEWLGPIVPPDQLPSFEIAHYGGGRAALLNASWGGEMLITPENFPARSDRGLHHSHRRTAHGREAIEFCESLVADVHRNLVEQFRMRNSNSASPPGPTARSAPANPTPSANSSACATSSS